MFKQTLALVSLALSLSANAALFSGQFTGTVTSYRDISGTGPGSSLVGETITGSFVYDTALAPANLNTAPPGSTSTTTTGDYRTNTVGSGFVDINFELAGLNFDVTPESKTATNGDKERLLIQDIPGVLDRFQLEEREGGFINDGNGNTFHDTESIVLYIKDDDQNLVDSAEPGQAFSWDTSFLSAPDDDAFGYFTQYGYTYSYDSATGESSYDFTNYWNINFDLQTFVVAPSAVPVPAAAWLFGSALVGLVGLKRKK